MSRPLRALFLSEGALGIGTVGHARIEPAVRAGLAGRDDVQARYVTLPPQGLAANSLARGVPGLGAADLDLQAVRWHMVQAVRARRLLERELRRAPADVVHVVSHSIALGMVSAMRRVPVLLSADVGIWPYREFALWAPLRPHSRAAMAPEPRARAPRAAQRRARPAVVGMGARGDRARGARRALRHPPSGDRPDGVPARAAAPARAPARAVRRRAVRPEGRPGRRRRRRARPAHARRRARPRDVRSGRAAARGARASRHRARGGARSAPAGRRRDGADARRRVALGRAGGDGLRRDRDLDVGRRRSRAARPRQRRRARAHRATRARSRTR